MEDESGLQEISWYHGELSRHQAEALLMSNGALGSYLLRKSRESGQLAVSVKCQDSVKHFLVKCSDGKIKFGFSEFQSLPELLAHFSQKPLVGSETGTLVLLHLPYPRQVSEPQTYESVRIHTALHGEPELLEPHADSLATKEGFLTKQGFIIKSWKLRWFTVFRHEMKYYKEPRSPSGPRAHLLSRVSPGRPGTLKRSRRWISRGAAQCSTTTRRTGPTCSEPHQPGWMQDEIPAGELAQGA
ncbi:dual adapter for phosphotyrosine and 3-phosphotyrosine and 3-phosphoinositide-like isoform X4 [Lampetra fluviatilis]